MRKIFRLLKLLDFEYLFVGSCDQAIKKVSKSYKFVALVVEEVTAYRLFDWQMKNSRMLKGFLLISYLSFARLNCG